MLGASHYKLEAQSSGKLYLVMQEGGRTSRQVTSSFPNGRFFLIPTLVNEFVFEIGGKEHLLQVPAEFDLNELLARKFGGIADLNQLERVVKPDLGYTGTRLKLSDDPFEEGEVVLAFDILLGDALFVDRFTYNFVKPKAGDPAVFRTGEIDKFNHELGTLEHIRKIQSQFLESEKTNTISSAWSENRRPTSINHSQGVWYDEVY